VPIPTAPKLREILRLEAERTLGNDWVVRHENHFYQVEAHNQRYPPAESKVTVCEWEDGTLEIQYWGRKLIWHAITERPAKPEVVAKTPQRPGTPAAAHMPKHPWRRNYQGTQARGSLSPAAGARLPVPLASAPP